MNNQMNMDFERWWSDLITHPDITRIKVSTLEVEDFKPLMRTAFFAGFRNGRVDAFLEMRRPYEPITGEVTDAS